MRNKEVGETPEPSLLPYLLVAAVAVMALLAAMFNVVEHVVAPIVAPMVAQVAHSIRAEPTGETAFAKDEAGKPSMEPFRPRS